MSNPNAERLAALFGQRESLEDWRDLLSSDGRSLSRKKILVHCRFPRSTLYQNQAVRELLARTEATLKGKQILGAGVLWEADRMQSTEAVALVAARVNDLFARLSDFRDRLNSIATEIDKYAQG